MEEKGGQNQEILISLELLEVKFEVVFKVVFGVWIEIFELHPSDKENSGEDGGTPISQGTSSNPVIIEEDSVLNDDKHAKEHQLPTLPSFPS